jgi:Large eukaryotic DNA virus major capsid protein/Major capsid protein N-terminus
MSTGAVFKLIANDGKADRMIMATELLNQRIKDITCLRARQGYADPTPTLVDLERTHILYVNAHFKPFAAIGYEYNKVKANTGNAQYNSTIQFSIPQFGDFFSDMVVNTVLAQTSATVGTVPLFSTSNFIGTTDQGYYTTADYNNASGFVAGAPIPGAYAIVSSVQQPGSVSAPGVYTRYIQRYVDFQGNAIATGAAAQNFVRYCEYPGLRLFKKVKFEVNGNPLDDYDYTCSLMHSKYAVLINKDVGWKRLVGQEVPVEAYSDLVAVTGSSKWGIPMTTPTPVTTSPSNLNTGLINVGGNQVGTPAASANTARFLTSVVNGPQTPKAVQPALEMWVPLLFWFNKDSRLSIPSVAIPYGQRYISIDTEQQSNILFVAPGNLYLETIVEVSTAANASVGDGTSAAQGVYDVQTYTTRQPVLAVNSNIDTTQQITNMELYINNIFLNPEIHDIYIKRIGFSLIRVHRYQNIQQTSSNGEVLLSQLKWPTESIFVGLQPAYNTSAANPNQYRDWYRLTLLVDNVVDQYAASTGKVAIDNTSAFYPIVPNAVNTTKSFSAQTSALRYTYPSTVLTVDSLQLKAHGINIFDKYSQKFFGAYLPYVFGGINLNNPLDEGALLLNFCLYPGTYQPSGHINVSRTREFYLYYYSSYVTPTTPANLLTIARAINFILISDGSAVLRYST